MLTGSEYRKSLEDGRKIYADGELVDVTTHPQFQTPIDSVAETYDRYYDPAPEAINAYFDPPRDVEELRHHVGVKVDTLTSLTYASLMTMLTSADRLESIRPQASEAIRAYVKDFQKRDLRMAECITDAKGDRSKPPLQQEDPDAYLRVVEERADGVVIRGAKLHISGAAFAHELLVMPTKAMKAGEEAYSIACAVPVNAPGVKVINVSPRPHDEADLIDAPVSAATHPDIGFVIFEDVFVPNERVFLNGETRAAAIFAHSLGLWVRINGLKNMADEADTLVGVAQLIAEANGLERTDNVRNKITDMIVHATLIRATLEASLAHATVSPDGIVVPDELYANAGKYQGAAHRAMMIQHIQDIAGGSLVTAPSTRDLGNAEVGELIRKYMGTKQSIDGEYRLKLFLAARDLTSSAFAGHRVVSIMQSGGGLFAQRIVTRRHYDMDSARQKALETLGLSDPFASTAE